MYTGHDHGRTMLFTWDSDAIAPLREAGFRHVRYLLPLPRIPPGSRPANGPRPGSGMRTSPLSATPCWPRLWPDCAPRTRVPDWRRQDRSLPGDSENPGSVRSAATSAGNFPSCLRTSRNWTPGNASSPTKHSSHGSPRSCTG
ncbi:hypothetical protein [Pseudodesulfovibrio tunisiensis]|uniref:hypothetical protein n=1 Tax=Pseudodesulfovibrio tunisiensis TaxID=463192 RepID=UPI001FB4E1DF|nr:hypothetical protein [Pseudodesulfovibrio tunisiensis]